MELGGTRPVHLSSTAEWARQGLGLGGPGQGWAWLDSSAWLLSALLLRPYSVTGTRKPLHPPGRRRSSRQWGALRQDCTSEPAAGLWPQRSSGRGCWMRVSVGDGRSWALQKAQCQGPQVAQWV